MTFCLRLHKSHGKQTPRVAFEDAAKPFASKDLGVMFHSRKKGTSESSGREGKNLPLQKSRSQEMPDTCQATKPSPTSTLAKLSVSFQNDFTF